MRNTPFLQSVRALVFGVFVGVSCFAPPAIAKNTEGIVEATNAPPLGGFVLLSGDFNGQQLYVVFSATIGGSGAIVLPVLVDGGSLAITGTANTQEVPNIVLLEYSFTPQTALYVLRDAWGPVTELANAARASGGGLMIHSVEVSDSEGLNPDFVMVFSDQAFTLTGDGSPFDPTDAEILGFTGRLSFVASNWESYPTNTNGEASLVNIGKLLTVDGTSVWVALMILAAPTYSGGQTITVRIYGFQE